jgi:serine/threonine protein kinase
MAPEMVILLSQPRAVRKGYTKAVDYWSLGVTIYKLLTGVRPFENKRFRAFMEDTQAKMGENFDKYEVSAVQAAGNA